MGIGFGLCEDGGKALGIGAGEFADDDGGAAADVLVMRFEVLVDVAPACATGVLSLPDFPAVPLFGGRVEEGEPVVVGDEAQREGKRGAAELDELVNWLIG